MKPFPREAEEHLKDVGAKHDPQALARLEEFAGYLESSVKDRRFGNLLGPGEMGRLWTRHILESAAYLPHVEKKGEVVDIGSGAGFPGLVLAILGVSVTLIESRRRRSLFLRFVRDRMKLDNVRVVHARVEQEGPYPGGTVFTARAVGNPSRLLPVLAKAAPEGFVLTTRSLCPEDIPLEKVVMKLPSPPLDRPGFMVQYRHPGGENPERCRGE